MLQGAIDLILVPGSSLKLVPVINVAVLCLLAVLCCLTYSKIDVIHLIVMSFLALGLLGSVNWWVIQRFCICETNRWCLIVFRSIGLSTSSTELKLRRKVVTAELHKVPRKHSWRKLIEISHYYQTQPSSPSCFLPIDIRLHSYAILHEQFVNFVNLSACINPMNLNILSRILTALSLFRSCTSRKDDIIDSIIRHSSNMFPLQR